MPAFFETFRRILEVDLFYPILVFYIAVALGSMYEFLFIIGLLMLGVSALLVIAHIKNNRVLRLVGKIANVAVTTTAFINIFANDLYFSDFIFAD